MEPLDRELLRWLLPPTKSLYVQRNPILIDKAAADELIDIAARLHAAKFSTDECSQAHKSLEQWAELLGCPYIYDWVQARRQDDPNYLLAAPIQDVIEAYLEEFPGLRARSITGRPRADGQGITPLLITYAIFGFALRLGLEQLRTMLGQEPDSAIKKASRKKSIRIPQNKTIQSECSSTS